MTIGSLAGAALLVTIAAPAAVATNSDVKGRYEAFVSTGPNCPSPQGVCSHGTLTGSIKGTFDWIVSDFIATADTPSTHVILYTATMAVTTNDGTFTCLDSGSLRMIEDRPISSLCVVIGGTGAYAGLTDSYARFTGFSGSVVATGSYDGRFVFA